MLPATTLNVTEANALQTGGLKTGFTAHQPHPKFRCGSRHKRNIWFA